MNRRELMAAGFAFAAGSTFSYSQTQYSGTQPIDSKARVESPSKITLDDYFPRSIYRIPVSNIERAKYPLIDVHSHGHGPLSVSEMVKMMDAVGVERTVIFTGASTAEQFSQIRRDYARFPGRFDLWCMFDLRSFGKPGFEADAVKSLEECHRAGALGIGELHDKGTGLDTRSEFLGSEDSYAWLEKLDQRSTPTHAPSAPNRKLSMGPHADDPRMDALWDKAAQLGMPISIHVSDPIWCYRPMDNTNDGLMNAWTWRIVLQPGMYDHDQLVNSLEKAAHKHPKTIFIACHLANLDYDLTRLGQMFDRNPNLYADIAARFAETATIPRFVHQFLSKYADRVVYGTDVVYEQSLFSTTFRILESEDEHFYQRGLLGSDNMNFNYHWTLNGFGLPDNVLKNLYHDNAINIFNKARQNAA
ncbi:MAG: amidohydrolase family protein [Acidobacteriaceae bacterium]